MTLISKREFQGLSRTKEDTCISIYIPTHRSGEEAITQKDALVLKEQLKKVESNLEDRGFSVNEIDKLTSPVKDLIEDRNFWRHQQEGLALFLTKNDLLKYTLPIKFDPVAYVSKGFYLRPLMPVFNYTDKFYILALELKGVNFYKATQHSIEKVRLSDDTPEQIEDVVGYDHEQKSLQFRTQMTGQATFHGHGEGKEDRKDEILLYFRTINKELMPMLHDEKAPMVVACLDYLFPMYEEANEYQFLVDQHISSNPKDLNEEELHGKAWDIVQPYFEKEHEEKKAIFGQFHGTGRTSTDIREILPAAIDGKVDTLFLEKGKDIWGHYDPAKRLVEVNDTENDQTLSITNIAVIEVFLQGGRVYSLDKEDMPDPESEVNALYRY